MICGETVKPEDASLKVRAAVGPIKVPVYIVEHHNGYRVYRAPGGGKLELIAEGNSLGSFVHGLGAFDASLRTRIGGCAAKLPEGKIVSVDEKGELLSKL